MPFKSYTLDTKGTRGGVGTTPLGSPKVKPITSSRPLLTLSRHAWRVVGYPIKFNKT